MWLPTNELHDYKILLNKADRNKEGIRLYGEKYMFGTQSSNKYLMNVCQVPSTDAGLGDTAGKGHKRSQFSRCLPPGGMRQKIKCPRKCTPMRSIVQKLSMGKREQLEIEWPF